MPLRLHKAVKVLDIDEKTKKPRIGITIGDAAGIGPEIIVKALARKSTYAVCQPIVIGSAEIIADALRFASITKPPPKVQIVERYYSPQSGVNTNPPMQLKATRGTIEVLDVAPLSPSDISHGSIDARAGAAAVEALAVATRLAMQGQLDGITTAPICKAACQRAGVPYPGHTEMLAAFTNTPQAVMMLMTPNENSGETSGKLRVAFVTTHIPLAEVPHAMTSEKIVEVIRITRQALMGWGIASPRLVIAALNPHAGEQGIFGKEEEKIIIPAIAQAKALFENSVIDGPLPADTLFIKASQENTWDAVIAMYHDQGSIPIKLLGFGQIVNVTLGLPIVRTSVDHGTAYDIAGKGIASESSLCAALACAAQLATRREH